MLMTIKEILSFILHLMNSFLTSNQVKEFQKMHKAEKRKQPSDKIKAILMLDRGFSFEEISRILLLDPTTIWRWYIAFKAKGIDGLFEDNFIGGTNKLTYEQLRSLTEHLEENVYLTAKEICQYVEKTFCTSYTTKGMTSLLHALGFRYKKPRHVPGKANITAQLEFIEQYTKLKVDKSSQDRIYFADAVHPLHNSQPAYGWIKKGSEMIIQSNTGRERINLNGAYCIEDHRLVIKEANTINSQSTIELFKEMLKRQPLGFIYIILDNARYYRSKDVKEFLQFHPRLRLMFLPAYSPNLNIIERLWKFFKKNITYNAYYEDFDTFHYYCLDFFKNIRKYRYKLETLMTDNFQLIRI